MVHVVPLMIETISSVFPPGVAVEAATNEMYDARLFDIESRSVSSAVPNRQREFAAGRAAARAALRRLGCMDQAIPVGEDREPCWPAGYVGSISHCRGLCCAAVARTDRLRSIGLDVEISGVLEEPLRGVVFTSADERHLCALAKIETVDWPTVGFSAKEAFYKCLFPTLRKNIDFLDVEVRMCADEGTSCGTFDIIPADETVTSAVQGHAFGRWAVGDGFVICGYSLLRRP